MNNTIFQTAYAKNYQLATIPNIPTLFSSPKPCSLRSTKKSLNLRPNQVKSSFSSSTSCSLTIKCRKHVKGSNGDRMSICEGLLAGMIYEHLDPFDLMNFTEGIANELQNSKELDDFVSHIINQVLQKEENWGFVQGVVKARENVHVAERQFEQQELEMKKMKEYIDKLENSSVDVCFSYKCIHFGCIPQ